MIALVEPRPGQRTIDELLATVSASRLTTWLQCRLKFWFRYLSGIQKPKSSALLVGSVVHLVLKHWNHARWQNQTLTLKEFHDAFSKAWISEQHTTAVAWETGEEEEKKAVAWRLFETYYREYPIPADEKPEAVEVSAEMDLASIGLPKLVGVIDLVRPGHIIIDYKTIGQTPDPERVRHTTEVQTSIYSLLYRDSTGQRESAIELHHLVKTKSPRLVVVEVPPTTQNQEARLHRVMGSYVEGLQREDFIPSPSMQCASCEFFNECRRWS